MSKATRSRSKIKRRSMKRARKAAEAAKYKAWADSGQNSKRSMRKRAKTRTVRNGSHATGPCGNIGCRTCNPTPYNLVTPRMLPCLSS